MRTFLTLFFVACTLAFSFTLNLPSYCGPPPGSFSFLKSRGYNDIVLRQVHVFTRTGDRSIIAGAPCWLNDTANYQTSVRIDSLPNNVPDKTISTTPQIYQEDFLEGRNYFPGNQILSDLSPQGYQQQYNLGKELREAYIHNVSFLSESYSEQEIFIRTLDVPQCVHSAEGLMEGLHPISLSSSTDDAELVDFNSMDLSMDDLYPNSGLCPVLTKYQKESRNTSYVIEHYTEYTLPLLEQLSPLVGQPAANISLSHLYDCLNVHICQDQPVPEELLDLYPQVEDENLFYANSSLSYPSPATFARAASGFLLQEVLGFMNLTINNSASTPKFILWSGQDATIMPLLSGFGVWDNQWTPYASTLIFELYEDSSISSGWAVRLIYNSQTLIIPGCDDQDLCDWSLFSNLLFALIPDSTDCKK